MNIWNQYSQKIPTFDELIETSGKPRSEAKMICDYLASLDRDSLRKKQLASDLSMENMGITFNVYKEGARVDRVWPFDIVPRIVPHSIWRKVSNGLIQRLRALNFFIDDIYNKKKIIKDGIFPKEIIQEAPFYLKACQGFRPPYGLWAHISGTDLVRDDKGEFFVLEDNLRIPSGVSYLLENRYVMKRVFPELFQEINVEPVDNYPIALFEILNSCCKRRVKYPKIVILTPGVYNSAYFEHSFLAQQVGAELVEGRDLFVDTDNIVYMKTIYGSKRVDVIYRRVDDSFLDPEVFNKESLLGVPGLMRAWIDGKVTIVNAPGTGIADDKFVYAYVPEMIRYYLSEEPLIKNVPTYLCFFEDHRKYVLENLKNLVVKPANASGGYGILIGPRASQSEIKKCANAIRKKPREFVAQPLVKLSTVPTLIKNQLEPRHVDLRPFVLLGPKGAYVTPGGLTRVALKKGSFVVNSSQGGGSKDTWILRS